MATVAVPMVHMVAPMVHLATVDTEQKLGICPRCRFPNGLNYPISVSRKSDFVILYDFVDSCWIQVFSLLSTAMTICRHMVVRAWARTVRLPHVHVCQQFDFVSP